MNTQEALQLASTHLAMHVGHTFDVFSIAKPKTMAAAINLTKIVSKLSPLVGNLIESSVVDLLNDEEQFQRCGTWKRQDPDFPDALFVGDIDPAPGIEIKAWFPLATEITARFKDSQNRFARDQTAVALLAWLPEHILYGKPTLLDVCVVPGRTVAEARDKHYHNPPDYLVIEPEDTTARTRNLQQTNTNGYKWQGTEGEFEEAKSVVDSWGEHAHTYSPTPEYQARLRELLGRFKYRLDTNYAKIDRIVHNGVEDFKTRVRGKTLYGRSLSEWAEILSTGNEKVLSEALLPILAADQGPAETQGPTTAT